MKYPFNPDRGTTLGLLGQSNSLAYRVHELERHFHGWDRRYGAAVTPSGETHVADICGPGVTYFSATGGNDTWGNWVQILGSSDTPKQSGYVKYDLHNLLVTGTDYAGIHFMQFAFGESADLAAKVAAYQYTAHIYEAASNQIETSSVPIMTTRQNAGTKCWFRIMAPGQNGKYLRIFFGLHEYEG